MNAPKWTTKFRSSSAFQTIWKRAVPFVLILALGGCVSYGEPAAGFSNAAVGAAYVPLAATDLLTERYGAAVVIAPGIAVTNAHNANLVDPKSVIASLSDYDLLYFRTSQSAAVATAAPYDGERVIAYGQGAGNELRMARGVVKHFWPAAFGYLSDAGPGFSGGPVVDASTGALVGITYGFFDDEDPAGRLMVAYDSAFVLKELANSKIAAKPN